MPNALSEAKCPKNDLTSFIEGHLIVLLYILNFTAVDLCTKALNVLNNHI